MMANRLTIRKRVCYAFLASTLALSFSVVMGEIALRCLPIPGVNFKVIEYDELVGRRAYPNSIWTYRSKRGDQVSRKVNQWGYLDVEHERVKTVGSYRIGFFGDSFTEARQVPIEATFFRQIEMKLADEGIETLAFGHSGFGTLHSYLICQKQMSFFDLDMIVYVFYGNDLGDNIRKIKRAPSWPYAEYSEGNFIIDNHFRQRYFGEPKWYQALIKFVSARSLLVQTLRHRMSLLLEYGVGTTRIRKERPRTFPANSAMTHPIPYQDDAPSTWPDSLREYAIKLDSSLILTWKKGVDAVSKKFAIFYIPDSGEWRKETALQDSWKPWLERLCQQLNIDFIDPTKSFLAAANNGAEIYFDHFTPDGHNAFAEAFLDWFKQERTAGRLEIANSASNNIAE